MRKSYCTNAYKKSAHFRANSFSIAPAAPANIEKQSYGVGTSMIVSNEQSPDNNFIDIKKERSKSTRRFCESKLSILPQLAISCRKKSSPLLDPLPYRIHRHLITPERTSISPEKNSDTSRSGSVSKNLKKSYRFTESFEERNKNELKQIEIAGKDNLSLSPRRISNPIMSPIQVAEHCQKLLRSLLNKKVYKFSHF